MNAPALPFRHSSFVIRHFILCCLALSLTDRIQADDAPPTVAKLVEALHSDDKQTRRDAVAELGRRARRHAVLVIVKLMDDQD